MYLNNQNISVSIVYYLLICQESARGERDGVAQKV